MTQREKRRPRFALWLKWRWRYLRWLPVIGPLLWEWADRRVDRWHDENAADKKSPTALDTPAHACG